VLFPLYAHTHAKDVEGTSVLWPFVSWAKGDDVRRLRLFPFYGRSVNRDRWTKRFILWPLWTSARFEYPGSAGEGFVLFPLVGHMRTGEQVTWMLVPPLVRWTSGGEETRLLCPWPFIQYSKGEVDKLYISPFWGRKQRDGYRSWFALWPIVRHEHIDRPDGVVERLHVVPLFFLKKRFVPGADAARGGEGEESRGSEGGEVSVPSAQPPVLDRTIELWPLFSYRREGDASRFRMLELWPGGEPAGVERNFAPFWTLYARTRAADGIRHEALWGLFRKSARGEAASSLSLFPLFSTHRNRGEEDARTLRILMGLVRYRREGLRKTCRLLYFLKFGREEKP
jgi:hypothetical protein